MKFKKIKPFDREVLDKYKTGDCLIHATPNPKFFSIAYWIQLISAPRNAEGAVAEHCANIILINGIPHVQSTLKTEDEVDGVIKKRKLQINYHVGTILLFEYLKLYDPIKTNIYYCPLSEKGRDILNDNMVSYQEKVEMIEGAPYESVWRFIKTGVDDEQIDWLDKFLKMIPYYKAWVPNVLKWAFKNNESASRFTCSASVSFKGVGTYLNPFNYSEDTPQDIAEKKMFEDTNYLISGETLKQLHNYNTTEVEFLTGE